MQKIKKCKKYLFINWNDTNKFYIEIYWKTDKNNDLEGLVQNYLEKIIIIQNTSCDINIINEEKIIKINKKIKR